MRKKIRLSLLLCLILGTALINSAFAVQAQTPPPPQPNIVAMVDTLSSDAQQPGNTRFVIFAPGKPDSKPLFDTTPDTVVQISPDGKLELVTVESQALAAAPDVTPTPNPNPATQGSGPLAYGPVGQALRTIPIDSGHQVLSSTFSADGRYLSYTTASLNNSDWVLGILDVATGKRIEFGGDYDNPAPGGFSGVANTIAWSADSKHIFVQTYEPFSANGGFDTVYSLDISAASFDKPGRLPVPSGTRLIKEGTTLGNVAVRNDGTKLAYSFTQVGNSSTPLPNETPPDAVTVLDLGTGNAIVTYKAEPGQALGVPLSWSPDGQKLVFVGGSYKNTGAVTSSRLLMLDMDTKQVSVTPVQADDPASSLDYVVACSNAVFYVASKPDASGQAITQTLFSAPLADLKTATRLQSASFISLLSCVPAS